eukprot:3287809-Rhodomonas_salina.1
MLLSCYAAMLLCCYAAELLSDNTKLCCYTKLLRSAAMYSPTPRKPTCVSAQASRDRTGASATPARRAPSRPR